jgi:hypothetical protein
VRLTVPSIAALPIFQGDQVTVTGVLGTTEANGTSAISVPGNPTLIDLLGTTFVNPYIGGGTLTDIGNVLLPSDYLAWRRVTWLGNPRRELEFVHPSMLTMRFPDIPIDVPSEFTVEGSALRVMPQDPTPLLLLYYQKIPALAAAPGGVNWLMTEHPDLYLFGALTEAQAYAVNADTAALWKARRDELFDEIEKLSNKTRGAGAVRTLAPTP